MNSELENLTPEEVEQAGWAQIAGQQQQQPQQRQQPQQQATSSTGTAGQQQQPGRVAVQVQRRNQGLKPVPIDNDFHDLDELAKTEQQIYHETAIASKTIGKNNGNTDPWQQSINTIATDQLLKTKEAEILQLKAEMRRM